MRPSRILAFLAFVAMATASAPSIAACHRCGRDHGNGGGDIGRFLFGKYAGCYPQLGLYLQQGVYTPPPSVYVPGERLQFGFCNPPSPVPPPGAYVQSGFRP